MQSQIFDYINKGNVEVDANHTQKLYKNHLAAVNTIWNNNSHNLHSPQWQVNVH